MTNKRREELQAIVAEFSCDRMRMLDILHEAQKSRGYVSDEDAVALAEFLKCSPADISEVVSFYHFFNSKPSGQTRIYLDDSIIARHAGYEQIKAAFEKELNVKIGQATEDGNFGLYATSCIGLSDQAPAALIGGTAFPSLKVEEVPQIIQRIKNGEELSQIAKKIESNLIKLGPVFGTQLSEQLVVERIKQMNSLEIIESIKQSGLRGRGGAGFSTGKKWESCAQVKAETRYVVCNADEGEPGTFKDRELLRNFAGWVLTGMRAAGKAIKAQEGIIYLRAEYEYLKQSLEKSIADLQAHPNWGDFAIRVQIGAGAYVCGEESALLESLEGKRGEPRLRPPFPVERGYKSAPTVVNNVETFAQAAWILQNGAEKFAALGTEKSKGTRLLSISGDVAKPGIYEIEWGATVKEILHECRAQDPHIVQVGGPSGICISMNEQERKICFEDLPTGGSFMVFSKKRSLFEILENFMSFFVRESCGNCTPCRAGNVYLRDLVLKFKSNQAFPADLVKLENWSKIVSQTSRCGLGVSAPNVLTTSLSAFPEIYNQALAAPQDPLIYPFDEARATSPHENAARNLK